MKVTRFGAHVMTEYDDGVLHTVYNGPVSYEEMQAMIDYEDLTNSPKVRLLIFDLHKFGGMDGATRRLGATAPKPSQRYFTAYLGASFSLRVFASMWNRATNFMHGEKYFLGFFEDERAAREWLHAQREAFERGNPK